MKLILFGLKGNDLIVVKFISAEDFVVKPLGFFPLIAAHVFNDLLTCQVHHTVESMYKPQSNLLFLLAQLLLSLQLFPDWGALLAANRGVFTLF